LPAGGNIKNTFTFLIHLDDTGEKNGALKVIPDSQNKRLSDEEIVLITQNCIPFNCEVNCGSILLIKPLLLHSSSKTLMKNAVE
jgi:ectoine hydroxylase-related dioxygenase (phytanoyl-CoA dioxygenase family)